MAYRDYNRDYNRSYKRSYHRGAVAAAAPTATRDATSNKFVPVSTAEFNNLGIASPSSIWLCQEASGNLADSVGAVTLSANGTADYQQAIAGWTRLGIHYTETAAERHGVAAGTYNPNSGSVAWLCYVLLTSAAGTRTFMPIAGAGGTPMWAGMTSAGLVRINCAGVATDGAADHRGQVRPVLFKYDRTATTVQIFTNLETVNGTYNAVTTDGIKGLGAGAGTPPVCDMLYAACWTGAAAEGLSAATLTALGW